MKSECGRDSKWRRGGLPDQPDAAAFKNLLDGKQINSTVGSV
jgi:hypothetical protein